MDEIGKKELKDCLTLWKFRVDKKRGYKWTSMDEQAYNQLVKLIEDSNNPFKMLKRMGFKPDYSQANKDTKAYDERIDEIVEHYERQDRESEQNLADCTEAIDVLIEERDALIEDLEMLRADK